MNALFKTTGAVIACVFSMSLATLLSPIVSQDQPSGLVSSADLSQVTSQLTVSLKTDLKGLVAKVEQLVSRSISFNKQPVSINGLDRPNITLTIGRGEFDVRVDEASGRVYLTTTLTADGNLEFWATIFGFYFNPRVHAQGTVTLSIDPVVEMNSVNPRAELSFSCAQAWVDDFGLIQPFVGRQDVTSQVQSAIESELNKFEPELNAMIQKEIRLDERVQELWEKLQTSIPISEDKLAWLTNVPQELVVSPFRVSNDIMEARVQLTSALSISIGASPQAPKRTEPTLRVDSAVPSNSCLQIPIVADYESLEQLVMSESRKEVSFGDSSTSISFGKIELSGINERLNADVTFTAKGGWFKSASGTIHFACKPVVKENTLSLDEIELDVDSRNLIVKFASWFSEKQLLESLQKKLTVDATPILEKAKVEANQKAAELTAQLPNEVKADLVVKSIRVASWIVQPNAMVLIMAVDGKATTEFFTVANDQQR